MCELFGICSSEPFEANELLESFYNHSVEHKDGWGLAVFRRGAVSMEKEPVKAIDSLYLRQRLSCRVEGSNLLAHIRLATIGQINYSNCHPFIWDDESGRTWTLVHNGTLFDSTLISPYFDMQEGTTDSEGVLLYIIDCINYESRRLGRALNADERFRVIDDIIVRLSADNKLNLLIYDGEIMYVHTNYKDSLNEWAASDKCVFCTRPLPTGSWHALPMNQLLAYKDGRRIKCGTIHDNEFFDEDHDFTALYSAFSEL